MKEPEALPEAWADLKRALSEGLEREIRWLERLVSWLNDRRFVQRFGRWGR